jgi:hypothetical protein
MYESLMVSDSELKRLEGMAAACKAAEDQGFLRKNSVGVSRSKKLQRKKKLVGSGEDEDEPGGGCCGGLSTAGCGGGSGVSCSGVDFSSGSGDGGGDVVAIRSVVSGTCNLSSPTEEEDLSRDNEPPPSRGIRNLDSLSEESQSRDIDPTPVRGIRNLDSLAEEGEKASIDQPPLVAFPHLDLNPEEKEGENRESEPALVRGIRNLDSLLLMNDSPSAGNVSTNEKPVAVPAAPVVEESGDGVFFV